MHNNLGLIVEAEAHMSLLKVVAFVMLWKLGWNRRKGIHSVKSVTGIPVNDASKLILMWPAGSKGWIALV